MFHYALLERMRKPLLIRDHNSTVGVAMLLGLYNGKRVDYPYIDIIKRIVNKQVDGKQEELSWRNGLKLLLL